MPPKIKIHPLFLALAAVIVWLNGWLNFVSVLLAVLLHETAHAIVARERGYISQKITLLPYGAVLYCEDNLDKVSNMLIASAGPLANFLIALLTVSSWWLFPSSYPYTEYFVYANITIGIFNLIPVYPLDGSRIIIAVSNKKFKTIKILKLVGIALSFVLFVLFITSFFYAYNLTLGIMAIFLFVGATNGTKQEMYVHILNCTPMTKYYDFGVLGKDLYISADIPLSRIVKLIDTHSVCTFFVLKNQKKIATLSERQMFEILSQFPLKTHLDACLAELVNLSKRTQQ